MRLGWFHKPVTGIAMVATVLAGLTGCFEADRPVQADSYVYAHTTAKQLVLTHEKRGTVTVDGAFHPPSFTEDGKFLFAVRDSDRITVIKVDGGATYTITCDCPRAVPAGGSTIAWLDSHNQVMTADLAAGSAAPAKLQVLLRRPFPDIDVTTELLAVAGGRVLTAYPVATSSYGGPVDIYLSDFTGRTNLRLGSTGGNLPISFTASSPPLQNGGYALAITAGLRSAPCERPAIAVINTATGEVDKRYTPLPLDSGSIDAHITDLWWSAQGQLLVGINSASCSIDGRSDAYTTAVWRFDTAWQKTETDGPMNSLRQLKPGLQLILGEPQQDGTHSLYLRAANAVRTQIATGVLSYATPLAQS